MQESAEEDGVEQQLHAQIDDLAGQLEAKEAAHQKEMTEKITAITALNGVVKVRSDVRAHIRGRTWSIPAISCTGCMLSGDS